MAVDGINGLNAISPASFLEKANPAKESGDFAASFADYLKDALNKANNMQLESEKLTDDLALGRTDNIHEVMIAAEKADVALQFAMQIRTKILDAYNEIMRIQI